MVFIIQPNKEGETKKCDACGMDIIGRLTDYKGRFPDKLQWQLFTERKAHYDKDGNCKGEINLNSTTPNTSDNTIIPQNTQEKDSSLDESTKTIVTNEATLLYKIKKEVEITLKDVAIDPHPGMIWQMTELIWQKYFGDKEK